MNPTEVRIFEKEINEYIFLYMEELYQSASVKAYINLKGDISKQYLKVNISSIYLVNAEINFTLNDFRRLLSQESKTVITNKILDGLRQLIIRDNLFKRAVEEYGEELDKMGNVEMENKLNSDKEFFEDVIVNLEQL